MIRVEKACLRLGQTTIFDDLGLRVDVGETVAVTGCSGCGKTSLLRVLAGLQPLDAGRMTIAGREMANVPPYQRGIGFLFQAANLWPHMNVARNISFGIRHWPVSASRQRVEDLLGAMGMIDFYHRMPGELSGGEARRVALARALAPRRPVLLLDEPSANLNAELAEKMREVIAAERQANGTTVILATHQPEDARALADRILRLRAGRLEPETTP